MFAGTTPTNPSGQEVLPHPSINVVVEPSGARIWGVPTRRNARLLGGQGWAVGSKLRPGVFTALTGVDAVSITDGSAAGDILLGPHLPLRAPEASAEALDSLLPEIEARLVRRAVDLDHPALELVESIMASMHHAAPRSRVEDIAAMNHIAPRTLQRLFRRYVGVGPKWVLKRLRIHQAIEKLASTSAPTWTRLAHDLGYYDQAHFIRDFHLVVGCSPARYAAEAKRGIGTRNRVQRSLL